MNRGKAPLLQILEVIISMWKNPGLTLTGRESIQSFI